MLRKIKSFLFENQTTKQTIVKNTFWLSVSNFGGRIIKAVIIIYGARVLGTSNWGVFSYAITLAGFVTLFMDPGINSILVRNASKADDEDRRKIFATTFLIKLGLLFIGVFLIAFIAPFFSTLPGAKALLPFAALILAFDTTREFFSALIRAREKMEWEAAIFLLTNLAVVIFGFIFLQRSATAHSFALAYTLGTGIGALAAVFVLWDYFKGLAKRFSPELIKPIISAAWPFAVIGALGLLLTNTDILIISWMRNASDVGIYSAAIRIVQILYLIPVVLQYSTLPTLARLANKDNPRFRIVFERTVSVLSMIGIPITIGSVILGTQIMILLYGPAYGAGSLAFKLLMLTMIFDYPTTIISTAVFAYDHQRSLIISSAIGGVTNVVFDLIFIPYFGIVGSAFATIIAQALSSAYLWRTMKRINYFHILPHLKKIAVASVGMGITTWFLSVRGMNAIPNIVISMAVYFVLLALLKEPLLADVKSIVSGKQEATVQTTFS